MTDFMNARTVWPRLLALPLLLIGGCGDSVTPPLGDFPVGTYEVTITENDIIPRTDLQHLPGRWRILFSSDAGFEAVRDGELFIAGAFTVHDDLVTITIVEGSFGCVEPTETYRWVLDDDELWLASEGTTACGYRAIVLTHKPLLRVG